MLSLGNLLIYCTQVLILVGAATIGTRIIQPSAPRTRLAFWRIVVAVCLLLPLWPTRVDVAPSSGTTVGATAIASHLQTMESSPTDWLSLVSWILLSGAAARGAWLAFGLLGLRRLRLSSGESTRDRNVEALRRSIAPEAEIRWHDGVDQPLTFGFWRPVVLLPRRLSDLSPEAQRAVVCHELLHVSRHDWAWTVVEESVQTVLWFHPAVWWALGQVQLSREETVDELVVAKTGARRPYMSALMMFAEARPAVASAIPYVRRRHLASRLRRLSQETNMSPARLALTGAALAVVIVGSSAAVVSTLPLHASASASTFTLLRTGVMPALQLKAASTEPISIKFKDASLTRILGFISGASGIAITYEKGFADLPKVSVDIKDATVEEALNQILTPNRLSYRVIDERSIVVGRQVR